MSCVDQQKDEKKYIKTGTMWTLNNMTNKMTQKTSKFMLNEIHDKAFE